jgi:hypothetical protein
MGLPGEITAQGSAVRSADAPQAREEQEAQEAPPVRDVGGEQIRAAPRTRDQGLFGNSAAQVR